MNIMSINPALTLAPNPDGANILMMRKALETLDRDGRNMINLLSQAAPPASPPHLGNTVDIKA
ncbi:putative motility protein [Anaeroselena agilis]|uniref:Motility protein n=1 Tax=Anaeroselena agilis TaxID=3063788 RepID=A0ABU3NTL9_9FIRM|nr:putative motility protein [Selenomonadales bacterium 4137-cl]